MKSAEKKWSSFLGKSKCNTKTKMNWVLQRPLNSCKNPREVYQDCLLFHILLQSWLSFKVIPSARQVQTDPWNEERNFKSWFLTRSWVFKQLKKTEQSTTFPLFLSWCDSLHYFFYLWEKNGNHLLQFLPSLLNTRNPSYALFLSHSFLTKEGFISLLSSSSATSHSSHLPRRIAIFFILHIKNHEEQKKQLQKKRTRPFGLQLLMKLNPCVKTGNSSSFISCANTSLEGRQKSSNIRTGSTKNKRSNMGHEIGCWV